MTHHQRALETAVLAGKILLENGAEISRVHGTIAYFLEAFGIEEHNVYVISNGIFATIGEGSDAPCHAVRTIESAGTHLGRIAAVNELSRAVAAPGANLGMETIRRRLEECERLPGLSRPRQLICCAFGAAGFCYIMGGAPLDALAAFFIGLALQGFLFGTARLNRFIVNVMGGAGVTLCAWLLVLMGVGQSLDSVIIGSIIPLVPGVLLTTAIRDFFNSDFLSGAIHLLEALLIAACLAAGVGGMLGLVGLMGG
jgi:uncharacterized membrane protein YjjP (DUF1212 family)